jgi:hypothetical protein
MNIPRVIAKEKVKNRGRLLRLALMLILLACWLDGCATPSSGNNYTFVNNSSYTVHISPSGQSWAAFDLLASQKHVLSIQDNVVYFNFDQTTLVLCDTSTPGTIVFTNGISARFEVIGTPGNPAATAAYISYEVGLSSVQVNNGNPVTLPWSYSFAGYSGEIVQLTAIQSPSLGYVTATIYANGSVFQTASSSDSSDAAQLFGLF